MRVTHHASIIATPEKVRALESIGVEYAREWPGDPVLCIKIDEDDPAWPRLKPLLEQWNDFTRFTTEFTEQEMRNAPYLELGSSWHWSYPQPEDSFGYTTLTYDPAGGCAKCGIVGQQRAPFRMKSEPRWGRRGIMQLNWVIGELFVTPEVYEAVFALHGIACMPVLKHNNGTELRTVVQLMVTKAVSLGKLADAWEKETCRICGRVKLSPLFKGQPPCPMIDRPGSIFRTHEWFGSGGQAFNRIVVSQQLCRDISAAKIRGAEFVPLA